MWRPTAPAEPAANAPSVAQPAPRAGWCRALPALVALVPLGVWAARWSGWPMLANALSVVVVALVLWAVARSAGRATAWLLAFAALGLALLAQDAGLPPVFLPPVAINLAIALVFAVSLREREPLIARLARRGGAVLTPEVARYCRRLTIVWAVWLAALAAVGVAIALHGDERVGAWWAGLVDYLLVAALFVGEYVYRQRFDPTPGGWRAHWRNAREGMRAPRA